jgi:hypothetical protein
MKQSVLEANKGRGHKRVLLTEQVLLSPSRSKLSTGPFPVRIDQLRLNRCKGSLVNLLVIEADKGRGISARFLWRSFSFSFSIKAFNQSLSCDNRSASIHWSVKYSFGSTRAQDSPKPRA